MPRVILKMLDSFELCSTSSSEVQMQTIDNVDGRLRLQGKVRDNEVIG